jgi:lactate permease
LNAIWSQAYDPLHSPVLSTVAAGLPIVVLLGSLALLRIKAHWAAFLGLGTALLVATLAFHMPVDRAFAAALYGGAFGLLPIGWIILNVIFLYTLTTEKGLFPVLQKSLAAVTGDRRLQLLLIAFCFGAFFEGAAGFGTPVAVTAAVLIGLGFKPLEASGLTLIANTAPVAFGALGTPIITLSAVSGLELHKLSAMVGRQLPFFSVLVPFWLVGASVGLRGMLGVWPALLVAGACFAIPQFLMSNFHGPWLVDIIAAVASMTALVLLLLVWHPKRMLGNGGSQRGLKPSPCPLPTREGVLSDPSPSRAAVIRAWTPWVILSVLVFLWGLPEVKAFLDRISVIRIPFPHLHQLVQRMPPVVPAPSVEAAVYQLNWLSATGTGIFLAAVIAGFVMGCRPAEMARLYWATLVRIRYSLVTVVAMLALGYLTRYSGLDATLGLAFARTGVLYPFFGTLLGWLGVALTGSDTSSNVLFGSLQCISAQQLGISSLLMAAANSSGGVMGKMIDAQSIVVASTATKWYGHEGDILRFVFFHSLVLAALVGVLVILQAYVFPFTALVVR